MDLIERAAKKGVEKKKKKTSLVERVVEQGDEAEAPAFRGIGSGSAPKKVLESSNKPDPSSLNPSLNEPSAGAAKEKKIGIGDPKKRGIGGNKTNQARGIGGGSPGVARGIGGAEPRKAVASPIVDSASPQSKPSAEKQRSRYEEIDLVSLRDAGYITPDMPPNLMSEEFRIIKRSILLNAFSKGDKKVENGNIVLVTSSNPGEGKTFCTINLALSIATEQDVTVLLVDADFSKPEVLNRLGIGGGKGLMDVVVDDDVELSDCLVRTSVPNLTVLPAGRQHNLTTELLASEQMEKMVQEIAHRYSDRIIIFDSPPVLASSAASVMALYTGQIVFVIEAEKTSEPQIKESISMVSACQNISLLLNKTRYSGSNKKFATYYGYGGR